MQLNLCKSLGPSKSSYYSQYRTLIFIKNTTLHFLSLSCSHLFSKWMNINVSLYFLTFTVIKFVYQNVLYEPANNSQTGKDKVGIKNVILLKPDSERRIEWSLFDKFNLKFKLLLWWRCACFVIPLEQPEGTCSSVGAT